MKSWWRKRKSFRSVMASLFSLPQTVAKETLDGSWDALDDWFETQDLWIELHYSLSEAYDQNYLVSNHVFRQFFVLLRELSWMTTSVASGAYESAARDLRYVLEDMCQAYYFDQERTGDTPEDDYERLRRGSRTRGAQLVNALRLALSVKEDIAALYSRLNSYAHPSHERLTENMEDIKVVLFYKVSWMDAVTQLHRQVFDALVYLVLRRFPKARNIFINRPYVRDSLRAMSCNLVLTDPS